MHSFPTLKVDQLPSAQSSPLADSHNRPQQHIQSFPTFEDPPKEPLHLTQSIPHSSTESFTSGSLAIVQQHTHSSPTFRDPLKEQLPVSQPVPDHIAQQEYLTLFCLGDQHPLQQAQPIFPQESVTPFILSGDPQLPVHEPGPPVPVAPL
jgi:hypothetical protein